MNKVLFGFVAGLLVGFELCSRLYVEKWFAFPKALANVVNDRVKGKL